MAILKHVEDFRWASGSPRTQNCPPLGHLLRLVPADFSVHSNLSPYFYQLSHHRTLFHCFRSKFQMKWKSKFQILALICMLYLIREKNWAANKLQLIVGSVRVQGRPCSLRMGWVPLLPVDVTSVPGSCPAPERIQKWDAVVGKSKMRIY